MSRNSHRWTPPHTDPAKPTNVPRERPPWGERCMWEDCDDYEDFWYKVRLCTVHAHVVRDGIAAHDQNVAERDEAWAAERGQRLQVAAEKIDAGIRLEHNDITPGWIYYLLIGDTIKIGYTTHVNTRMRAYPPNAQLLAVEPGTKRLERDRHIHFDAHLSRGREWFRDAPEIRTWTDTLIAEYGDPSHMAYTFTKARGRTA